MKFFIMLLLIFTAEAMASDKAQVIVLRGNVTKLEPGEHIATQVKKGDWLNEDTSLVTKEKSFVKLRFSDNSTMNVGPESMVVINKMPEKKANMVNLLKGMIKAEVKKENHKENTKNKLLVRTRSAVMGVRGTKFQTMYNHANKRTSLVTVEGNVAMVRNIKKDDTELLKAGKTLNESQAEDVAELDKMFEENPNTVVEVTAGKYSGVAESIQVPTEPVKIAPEQYDAIAKSMDSKNRAAEIMKPVEGEEIAKGSIDETTGKIIPKAGGIVDFETGLYIAPEADAKLDKKTGTFRAKKIGKVDPRTGDYIPPKGIKVDSKKGFIVDQTTIATLASNEDKAEVVALAQELNQGVVKKQVTTIKQVEKEIKEEKKDSWGPKNHLLSFQVRPYSNNMKVKDKSINKTENYNSSKATWSYFTWDQQWNEKWSSRLRVGGHEYVLDDSGYKVYNYGEGDNGDGFHSFGVAYQWKPRLKVYFDFVGRDQFYVIPENTDGVRVQHQEMRTLDVAFEYNTLKWLGLDTRLTGVLHLLGDGSAPLRQAPPDEDTKIFGATIEATGLYHFNKSLALDFGLFYQRIDTTNADFEFTHENTGLILQFIWDI